MLAVRRGVKGPSGRYHPLVSSLVFFSSVLLSFFSSCNAANVTLAWDAPNPPTNVVGYNLYYGEALGNYKTVISVGNQTTYQVTGLLDGHTYYFAVKARGPLGNESGFSNEVSHAVPSPPNSPASTAIRVNAGGGSFTDSSGNLWLADSGFNTGSTSSTADPINGTTSDALYQSERFDPAASPELTYSFTVPNGTYAVNLHFAEIYDGASLVGGRVFNVTLQGQLVLPNLDIFKEVGHDAALVKSFSVAVTNGQLTIQLSHGVENPKISAIEILGQGVADGVAPSVPSGLTRSALSSTQVQLAWNAATDSGGSGLAGYRVYRNGTVVGTSSTPGFTDSGLTGSTSYSYAVTAFDKAGNESARSAAVTVTTPAPPATAIRVNAGGGSFTDSSGNLWLADSGFNTGSTFSTTHSISGTTNDALYQSERFDPAASPELTYSFSVPNGTYTVNLHFAEIYDGTSLVGGRVFNVYLQGQRVLSDLDIFKEVGHDAALTKSLTATVTNGQLTIQLIHGVENPKISAIEILSASSVQTSSTQSKSSRNSTLQASAQMNPSSEACHTEGTTLLEAEEGSLEGPMEVFLDPDASGGVCVGVVQGMQGLPSPSAEPGTARYVFHVPVSGTYALWGRVKTVNTLHHGFWIGMDSKPPINWETAVAGDDEWIWYQVKEGDQSSPVRLFLDAGAHALSIKQEDDGAKIDQILITACAEYFGDRVYEDAQDGSTLRWITGNGDPKASIANVFDEDRESNVIDISGANSRNTYALLTDDGTPWFNTKQKTIEWSLKTANRFTIYADVDTTAGRRLLIYTPTGYDRLGNKVNVYFGLGADILDGRWHTFVRDLQADLWRAQPAVDIVAVNGFSIRGLGRLDDVKLR